MILPNDSLILKTKITLPLLKNRIVKRERLLRELETGSAGRLTIISAPAGFGKSTLIAQWVRETGRTCGWVALDERDNDSIRFWRYITYALAFPLPELQGGKLLQLARTLPGLSVNTFLDALVNELFNLPEMTLVLDDLHFITDRAILDGLAYLIEYLPEQIHVLLSTRTELPFPSIKWKAREERTEITMAQLQFTGEEAGLFFGQAADVYPSLRGLTEQHISRLAEQTEGWVTGMQLIALSLRTESDFTRLLEGFRGNRNITDYLFHEVLDGLPAPLYTFLLKTSVLTRLDGAVCEAVTGHASALEELHELLRLNMFILPLDERNEWFRYHHLFAQFLQDQLRRTRGEGEWSLLHEKTAVYWASAGAMDEAVEHALYAGAYGLAESYLARHAAEMLERGEVVTLLQWLRRFPEEYPLSPETGMLLAFVCVLTGQLPEAEARLEELETGLREEADEERRRSLQSGLLFVRSNLVFMNGDFAKWFAFSEGILDHIVPDNPLYFNFNYNRREPQVRKTPLGLKGVLSADTEKIGLMFTGVLEKHGWGDTLIALYVKQSLCEGYYEWNRLEECRELLERIGRASACTRTAGLALPNRLMEARLHMSERRWSAARLVLEETAESARMQYGTDWLPFIGAIRCRLELEEGNLAEAKKEMAKLGLSAKDKPSFNQEYLYLTLVRLLGKQRKEADGLKLLELLAPQARREQQLSSIVEIGMLQALLEHKRGRKLEAFRYLDEVLPAAEQNGYIRLFVDEGTEMLTLLNKYAETARERLEADAGQGAAGHAGGTGEYVRRLISAFPAEAAEPAVPMMRAAAELIEPLNRSETELLALLRQGATNKEIARALSLSEGTVRVYLSRLYNKLQVTSRTQALIAAQELHLLD